MKAAITNTIHTFGEAVEYTPKGGSTLYLTALVQVPAADALVNDYDLNSFVVYIAPGDVPAMPSKFDRLKLRGSVRGINEVQVENAKGEILAYVLRVQG